MNPSGSIPDVVIPIAVPIETINNFLPAINIEAQIVSPPVRIPGSVWGPTCQKCGKQFERNLNLAMNDKNYYHCAACVVQSQSCVIQ